MTNQELFDRVARHLIQQGRPATDGAGCRYRVFQPDGTVLKCAIGCLIPDHVYTRSLEMTPLTGAKFREITGLCIHQMSLAFALQGAHDKAHRTGDAFGEVILGNLRDVADAFKLSTNVLDEVGR